jgi:UDP-N-acetylmuramoyl-L-alanyl-D-glutamate--2,6-diaminopimelate ligase
MAVMPSVAMSLLLHDIDVLESTGNLSAVEVSGISHDSRRTVPGDLFCCVPGLVTDGHAHAAEAVERGAVGVLCEHFIPELEDQTVVQTRILPGTMRAVMGRLAAAFYGFPARDLLMIGVTGTNGKTTVTQLLGDLLSATGRPTNVMGTLSGARTTPEATEVQRVLAGVRDRQRSDGLPHAVAMEVSSHALVQSRVEGIHFDVAVFTNLSHDHLDYHRTMEEYFEAKAKLFSPDHALRAVVDADDAWGQRLLDRARIPTVAVRHSDATDITLGAGHTQFTWRGMRITTPLTGAVNVDNSLLAAEAAVALGIDPVDVARGMAHVAPVPGRLQVVASPTVEGVRGSGPTGQLGSRGSGDLGGASLGGIPFTVIVDYAHTPAGLEVVLAEARTLASDGGRVLCVFGCGGNRDRAKRPLMGRAADQGSDVAFLTSDNPRDEDPAAIIADVMAGVVRSAQGGRAGSPDLVVEPDRHVAIRLALDSARPGDVVVIAGKGHETYQEIAGKRIPFDDADEARRALAARYRTDPSARVPSALPDDTSPDS